MLAIILLILSLRIINATATFNLNLFDDITRRSISVLCVRLGKTPDLDNKFENKWEKVLIQI